MIWSLHTATGNYTLTELGLNGTLTRANMSADVLSLNAAGRAFDVDALFPYGAVIALYRGDTRWFVGRRMVNPHHGNPNAEAHDFEIAGPWVWLEKQAYLQKWMQFGGASDESQADISRVLLHQSITGARLPMADAVRQVLEFCVALGHPFQIGEIDLPGPVEMPECKNLKASEALTNLLRWAPDAVAWFDYATDPVPTLHVKRRGSLEATALFYGEGSPLSTIPTITRRDDLLSTRVVLVYEINSQVDGATMTQYARDAAPPDSTGLELDCVVETIPWQGSQTTVQRQPIRTVPLHASDADLGASPENTKKYWKRIYPALSAPGVTSWEFAKFPAPWPQVPGVYFTRELANAHDEDDGTGSGSGQNPVVPDGDIWSFDPGNPVTVDDDQEEVNPNLNRELVEGSITDWMVAKHGIKSQVQKLTAYVSINGAEPVWISANVTATNASTKTYTTDEYTPGEEIPQGLAAQYLAAVSVPQFEAEFALVEQECSGLVGMGQVINLVNSREEYGTMRALVQSVFEDLETGTTTIRTGPPGVLGIQDLIERNRIIRGMTGQVAFGTVRDTSSRQTGRAPLDDQIGGGRRAPVQNATALPAPATAEVTHAFQGYRSSFTGQGEPPADQGRRVRLRMGDVNGRIPSNIRAEFVIPANSTDYKLYLTAQLSYSGVGLVITSLVINGTSGAIPETEATNNPAIAYRLIGTVSTNADSITSIENSLTTSPSLQRVLWDANCVSRNYSLTWYV